MSTQGRLGHGIFVRYRGAGQTFDVVIVVAKRVVDERVLPKLFGVEVGGRAEPMARVKTLIESAIKSVEVYTNIGEQVAIDGVCRARFNEGLRPAIADQCLSVNCVLIAFGVAAKVIVVIEDQDCFVWPVLLAIKHRCRQAAQSRAHHDQVVVFIDRLRHSRLITPLPAPLVGNSVGAGVTASQTRQCRWVGCSVVSSKQRRGPAYTGTGKCDRAAVDEVSSCEFGHLGALNGL